MRAKHSFASRVGWLYLRSMMPSPPSGVLPAAASPLLVVGGDLVLVLVAALVAAVTGVLVHFAVSVRAQRRLTLRVVERAPRVASRNAA